MFYQNITQRCNCLHYVVFVEQKTDGQTEFNEWYLAHPYSLFLDVLLVKISPVIVFHIMYHNDKYCWFSDWFALMLQLSHTDSYEQNVYKFTKSKMLGKRGTCTK